MDRKHDVIVVGGGPAGTALVSALGRRGLDVAWCAPDLGEPWPNNYGIWVDELPRHLPASVFERTWARPLVRVGDREWSLERPYGRIDDEALRRSLLEGVSVREVTGRVVEVEHEEEESRAILDDGTELTARFVFDATGAGHLLRREESGEVAAQTAFGILADIEGDPIGGAEMALMDFDASWRSDDDGPATFLYAMHLGGTRWFLEETVLVERPPHPIDALRDDLHRRLEARGVRVLEIHEEERCFIPMGTPIPEHQRVIGFGAAAGFVHPASGYSLARSLDAAPGVAEAVVKELANWESVETQTAALWNAVWPAERRRSRELYRFGMETLLTFDRDETERFFTAFFELPEESWQGYLSDRLSAGGVQRVMLRLFAGSDMRVRLSLASAAMGRNGLTLLKAVFGF